VFSFYFLFFFRIEDYCNNYSLSQQEEPFHIFDDLSPVVTTKHCFDDLRVGPEHVSRKPTDTYYLDAETVLRAHTSAHQTTYIRQGVKAFLCTGDVYRRDEIDSSHYPVFHQMEGVKIFPKGDPVFQGLKTQEEINAYIEKDLKTILSGLASHLFGEGVPMRWNKDYFPFTEPSFELEVQFNGKWMEVLGCGVIHKEVLTNSQRGEDFGWAFGLGLERLAMILFDIPDIRLFWSEDERFLEQFRGVGDGNLNKLMKFKPYSKFPLCYKDVSFWLPEKAKDSLLAEGEDSIHPNDIYEVREQQMIVFSLFLFSHLFFSLVNS
jgi:phenylalanyl-tRNA synthetase alpha chain